MLDTIRYMVGEDFLLHRAQRSYGVAENARIDPWSGIAKNHPKHKREQNDAQP
jgi:hypothetical protein